jgi:nucleotide-binding universal stress UspA family protein
MMFETILVATDGSERAAEAGEHAVGLAKQYGATLHGVFVVDTTLLGEPALSTAELSVDAMEDRGHEILEELAATADEHGVEFVLRTCHGVPKEEIVAYAATVGADLVVVGAYGNNPGHRTGSVADHVFEHTPGPVLKI